MRPQTGVPGRITELDALRGFALCGIAFINVYQVMEMENVPFVLEAFVRYHFFPIFSVLFGLGFGVFLQSAPTQTGRPRTALLYRLAALAAVGVPHSLLQPGEVLLPYALCGVVFLLPSSYLSRPSIAGAALALLAAGLALGGGVLELIPGLLLLGYTGAVYGLHRSVPHHTLGLVLTLIALAGAAGLSHWAAAQPFAPGVVSGLVVERNGGALLTSAAYAAGFLLLLRTPVAGALSAVFSPLGRMALTNYVCATLVFVPAGHALGLYGSSEWSTHTALVLGILAVQAVLSPLWLSRFRYGPLEWAWRCATYGKTIPLRKKPAEP